ncbi:MAG TPA: tripartite tricarboxylate transporter substrate binding protein [Methylomirabilota bacterium]|nr:tripartite tricarboxylate transporter substrate binding protein [Methylomirabilota bacterium]
MPGLRSRRAAIITLFSAATVGIAGIAAADAWQPRRAVEIVVPSAPGGGLDLAGRTLQGVVEQDKLSGKPLTVLNRPGGGGTVAIAYINTHAGDGHYAVVQALPLITNRLTGQSEIGLGDVTPLAQLLTEQVIFSVAADSPIKSGQDLITELKKDPAGVTVGVSSSPGGQSHIAAALVLRAAGEDPAKLKIVFFDSGGEAATALMGGHITVAVTPAAVVLGPAKAGKIRMIGLPAATRQKGELAEIPTWKEQGLDVEFSTWRVLVGPKDMTADEIAWWDDTLGKATSSPEWAAAAERNLWTIDYKNSKDVRAFLDSEQTRLADLLKDLGLAKQ